MDLFPEEDIPTDWLFLSKEPERSIKFIYKEKKEEMEASVYIDGDGNTIDFKILARRREKECPLTDFMFIKEALKDGTAHITRSDLKKKIVSGTFGNNDRLSKDVSTRISKSTRTTIRT